MASQPSGQPRKPPVSDGARPFAEISRLARLATAGAIPDAIRRCRRVAPGIGASSFTLFFTGRGPATARLVPCFDEEFPGTSQTTALLVANASDALSRHAAQSALPGRWMAAGHATLAAEPFVVNLPCVIPDISGIALPVSADAGPAGLFVFSGMLMRVEGDGLHRLHELCFEMFAPIATIRTGSASSASAISKRELECLKLTAAGRTSEDIARILGLSVHTANQYLTSAAAKLDAVNRMQAVAKAIRLGLID